MGDCLGFLVLWWVLWIVLGLGLVMVCCLLLFLVVSYSLLGLVGLCLRVGWFLV